jgi:hypothetical protein
MDATNRKVTGVPVLMHLTRFNLICTSDPIVLQAFTDALAILVVDV